VVRTLHSGTIAPGSFQLIWDGNDSAGRRVGAGIYWVRASGGNIEQAVKAVRIR
jgi:flagellar hook assembly protein FlgD